MAKTNKLNRNSGSPGIYEMTVNGVHITLLSRKGVSDNTLRRDEIKAVGNGKYIYTPEIDRTKLYRAAGYDTNKIDFAVPQSWLNEPANKRKWQSGDRAVWSYEGTRYRMSGRPIFDSQAWKKLAGIIKRRSAVGRR